MKNLNFKLIAFLVFITVVGTACSVDNNDNYCFSSSFIAPKAVTGPDTTTINTPIVINVSYIPLGTCGKFNKFNETATFPKEIRILLDYNGCNCPATDKVSTEPYTFTATTAGTYELRFITATNTPIVKTITVTE